MLDALLHRNGYWVKLLLVCIWCWCWLLGCTGIAVELSWSLSAVGTVTCLCRNDCLVKLEMVCSWCWLLGCVGMADGLNWCWSAVDADSCVVVLWRSGEIQSDFGRLSEVFSEKSCLNEKSRSDGFGWLCWVCGRDWLDFTSSSPGGKDSNRTFGSLVWWWGRRPLEEGTDTFPPGSVYLSLPPTRQDLTQSQWPEGRIIVGIKGGGGRAWAEARAEAQAEEDYAGHQLT